MPAATGPAQGVAASRRAAQQLNTNSNGTNSEEGRTAGPSPPQASCESPSDPLSPVTSLMHGGPTWVTASTEDNGRPSALGSQRFSSMSYPRMLSDPTSATPPQKKLNTSASPTRAGRLFLNTPAGYDPMPKLGGRQRSFSPHTQQGRHTLSRGDSGASASRGASRGDSGASSPALKGPFMPPRQRSMDNRQSGSLSLSIGPPGVFSPAVSFSGGLAPSESPDKNRGYKTE